MKYLKNLFDSNNNIPENKIIFCLSGRLFNLDSNLNNGSDYHHQNHEFLEWSLILFFSSLINSLKHIKNSNRQSF